MKMSAALLVSAMLLIPVPGRTEALPDTDGDGVPDINDVCQHTPPHAIVDSQGCATDEDFDGVPDGLDLCPHSEFGTAVDGDGCAVTQRPAQAAAPAPAVAPAPTATPPVVVPAPPPPAPTPRRATSTIAAPLPDTGPATSAAPPSVNPLAPDAGALSAKPTLPKAPTIAPVAVPPPAPMIAPAPTPQPESPMPEMQDDQRALLDEIDRREREREQAEAGATPITAAAAPAVEPTVLSERDPNLFSEVLFARGKSDFNEGDVRSLRDALPQLVSLMQRSPKLHLVVVGHADPASEHAGADKLAAARALAVHAYLIGHGISPKRSARASQGAAHPVVVHGDSARNRRVEILVYAD